MLGPEGSLNGHDAVAVSGDETVLGVNVFHDLCVDGQRLDLFVNWVDFDEND